MNNGKEFIEMHGYDEYDYGWRGMYPAIGRFTTIDPLAEKYYDVSPYAYCANNPIMLVDPDGREWIEGEQKQITWNDKAISQKAMKDENIKGTFLGANVLVGTHNRDENLKEPINTAKFDLYLESNKEGSTATIYGNTVPADVERFGTLAEGLYPAKYTTYKGDGALLINDGKTLPTVCGNPNNKQNYDQNGSLKPIDQHVMTGILFHKGNNNRESLTDFSGTPYSEGCQTGGSYKGSHIDYRNFISCFPPQFRGMYYLRGK